MAARANFQTALTAFSGDAEHPAAREVIFADDAGRRTPAGGTSRQSGLPAVRDEPAAALIVAEALPESAPADIADLTAAIAADLTEVWPAGPAVAILTHAAPRFSSG